MLKSPSEIERADQDEQMQRHTSTFAGTSVHVTRLSPRQLGLLAPVVGRARPRHRRPRVVGIFRCAKILDTAASSVSTARTRRRPPQCAHAKTSTENVRRISVGQSTLGEDGINAPFSSRSQCFTDSTFAEIKRTATVPASAADPTEDSRS
jgi:hypothetical protein